MHCKIKAQNIALTLPAFQKNILHLVTRQGEKDMVTAQWQYLLNDTALSDMQAAQVILWRQGWCAFGYNPDGKILIIEYRSGEKDIDDIALENAILSLPLLAGPQQVKCVWIAESRNILIPENLFTERDAAAWLNRLHFIEQYETALHEKIKLADTVLTYPLSMHRQHLLKQYFPEALIKPLIAMPATNSQGNKAQVTIINGLALLCITSGDKLLLHQWYPYATAEDIVYRIALVQDKYQLPQNDMNITLTGIGADLAQLSSQMETYYSNINAIPDNEAAGIEFLTNLALCAS